MKSILEALSMGIFVGIYASQHALAKTENATAYSWGNQQWMG